jgi:hypothetical protein
VQFLNVVMGIILLEIYSIHSSFSMFVEVLKLVIDYINFKANKIYFLKKSIKKNLMSTCYQKFNCKNIVLVIMICGGLDVFSPLTPQ